MEALTRHLLTPVLRRYSNERHALTNSTRSLSSPTRLHLGKGRVCCSRPARTREKKNGFIAKGIFRVKHFSYLDIDSTYIYKITTIRKSRASVGVPPLKEGNMVQAMIHTPMEAFTLCMMLRCHVMYCTMGATSHEILRQMSSLSGLCVGGNTPSFPPPHTPSLN